MKVASTVLFSSLSIPSINAIGFRGTKSNAIVAAQPKAESESDAKLAAFLQDLDAPAADDESNRRNLVASDCATNSNYYYVDWSTTNWSTGTCKTGRKQCLYKTYNTHEECCTKNFPKQPGNVCLVDADLAPTMSPSTVAQLGSGSGAGGAGFYYPDYSTSWDIAGCLNTLPLPYKFKGDRPEYSTMLECCKGSYGQQKSGTCLAGLPNQPTDSPTTVEYMGNGGGGYYTVRGIFEEGTCINTLPLPTGLEWWEDHFYDSALECCQKEYMNQKYGACFANLPEAVRPTVSPTTVEFLEAGGGGYYTLRAGAYEEQTCTNAMPLPTGLEWWKDHFYGSMLECCQKEYRGQRSGACIDNLPEAVRPTDSPTTVALLEAGGTGYYPVDRADWRMGTCINTKPPPVNEADHLFDTQLECCTAMFRNQDSGACLNELPNPPTDSPTTVELAQDGGTDYYSISWSSGECTNDRPVPTDYSRDMFSTEEDCCAAKFPNEGAPYDCMCKANPCYSCECSGTGSWKDASNTCTNNLDCD